MTIYFKFSLWTTLLVIGLSGILFVFSTIQAEKSLQEEISSNVTQQSKQWAENIEKFILFSLNEVQLAAKNAYFRRTNRTSDQLVDRLQELENLNSLYYNFSFFNMDRVCLADSKRQLIGTKHPNTSYWLKLSPEDATMDIAISASSNQMEMHFAAVVQEDNDNQPIGVLVGTIRVDELCKLMDDFSLSDEVNRRVVVNLVNSNGVLLYSNTGKINASGTYNQFDLIKDLNNEGGTILESEEELIFVTKDTGYQTFTDHDWKLVLSIKKNQAFFPLTNLQANLIYVIIGFLLISLFLAFIAVNVFVRPFVKLSKAAEEIGKGNLTINIARTDNGEIGKLARALQKITRILIQRIGEKQQLNKRLHDQKAQFEAQKGDIENIHEEIRNSINYSKRIQHSILPDPKELKRVFKDKLLFYRPKEVVSGDFYWFERVQTDRKEHMIVVAADCTGHGVPGAIMSMIGSNQLTNIVYYQNYIDPEKILARLNKAIKFELYREANVDEPRHDGMEVGICVVDLDTMELVFVGAGIPMLFIRNGEMEWYKSPKLTIGRMEGREKITEKQFSPVKIQLETGDRLYMYSDGFQDQFGGPSDKRIMSKNFRHLLLTSNQDMTMEEQEAKLSQTFDHWKGNGRQTDDVLVLGFEV